MDFTPLSGPPTKRTSYAPVQASVTQIYLMAFLLIGGVLGIGLVQFLGDFPGGEVVLWLSVAAVVAASVYFIVKIRKGLRSRPDVSGRLSAFAAANSLRYTTQGAVPEYPGAIFRTGYKQWTFDRLESTSGRYIDVGNLGYEVPAGKTNATETWGYVAIRLDNTLPHIVLEATKYDQNTTGALPVSVDRSQRLSLEGDFDRHFTVYCPADYETDALYIFAPDLMALVIDEVGALHIEIIDDWLFVYSPDDFQGYDAAAYERLYRMIDLLKAKALRQTKAYRDEHATPAAPASGATLTPAAAAPYAAVHSVPQGARMRLGTSQYNRLFWISAVVIGAMVLIFVVVALVAYVTSGEYLADVQNG